jgi:hypothetical protein
MLLRNWRSLHHQSQFFVQYFLTIFFLIHQQVQQQLQHRKIKKVLLPLAALLKTTKYRRPHQPFHQQLQIK